MSNYILEKVLFLDPWEKIDGNSLYFENELYNEIDKGHRLYGIKLKAIARKCDDILFYIDDNSNNYAMVHLSWKEDKEKNIQYPLARIFTSFDEWIVQCMITDYLEYVDSLQIFEVKEAHRRINNEIILFGEFSSHIKLGCYLIDEENTNINYTVKGIESLNFIDKSKLYLNPWIIIETSNNNPEEFIGRRFIIGSNE